MNLAIISTTFPLATPIFATFCWASLVVERDGMRTLRSMRLPQWMDHPCIWPWKGRNRQTRLPTMSGAKEHGRRSDYSTANGENRERQP